MENQRNLVLAIAISILIMVGFQFLFPKPQPSHRQPVQQSEQQEAAQTANAPSPPKTQTAQPTPQGPAASAPVPAATAAAKAAEESPRIQIESPRLKGSIALRGARIDQLTLSDYHETVDPNSPPITLFTPSFKKDPYFAESGWLAKDKSVQVPTADTVWKADSDTLSPGKPVHLTWDNGHGLVFTRTISVDDEYLFTITDSIANHSGQPVTLYSYGLISRTGMPTALPATYLIHEGPTAVANGTREDMTFKSEKGKQNPATETFKSKGGWVGIADQYWLAAFAWDQNQEATEHLSHHLDNNADKYQADYLGPATDIPASGSVQTTAYLFAGAKEVKLLDAYSKNPGIQHFDLANDWGWFPFITKPIFYALDWLNYLIGNFGLAIMVLTVCVKGVFFPLANKSYRSMSAMRQLQPQMQALRERYKDDKAKLNQAVMELYRKEKVNPAAGCLPIVIQIPVFYSLYSVLYITIEMRHAPFFGWIHDLSAPDPTSVFNLFGLLPFAPPAFLPPIGAWAIIMGFTMFFQMRLNPQPADPIQAKIFMFMPLIFTVILAPFPAGLVIYWAWNNTLSMAQQWVIMHRMQKKTGARR